MSVTLKPGVVLTTLDYGGYVIVDAIREAGKRLHLDLTITCGNEAHAPGTPHPLGRAIDVRSHDFGPDKKMLVLETIMQILAEWHGEAVVNLSDVKLATAQFFGQLEHVGHPNEHYHLQVRKNTTYSIEDLLS